MSVNEFTTGELVEFKGSKKGIIVNIKRKATFDEIKNSIIDKLESSIGFFNGAKICSINCEYLSDIQIMMLKDDISSKFDVEFIEEYNKKEITNFQTKYVTNLRSGENIEFDGDIIVMTDMKSGSQVSATCNVVVMDPFGFRLRIDRSHSFCEVCLDLFDAGCFIVAEACNYIIYSNRCGCRTSQFRRSGRKQSC